MIHRGILAALFLCALLPRVLCAETQPSNSALNFKESFKAEPAPPPPATRSPWGLQFANEFQATNYEYFGIPFRNGETILGDVFEAEGRYYLTERDYFAVGLLARKQYDGGGLDKIYPRARFQHSSEGNWTLLFGSLQRKHNFLWPVLDQLAYFTRPYGDGFQALYQTETVSLDIFWDWWLYDTTAHPEKFVTALLAEWRIDPFRIKFQTRWNHHGGQLYPHSGINLIHDRTTALGAEFRFPLFSEVALIGSVYGLSNYYFDDVVSSNIHMGSALLTRIGIEFWKWNIFHEHWGSQDFYNEEGDPFYRADTFEALAIQRKFVILDKLAEGAFELHNRWYRDNLALMYFVKMTVQWEAL